MRCLQCYRADIQVDSTWRQHVLVMPGWKNGFCPLRVYDTSHLCNVYCIPARLTIRVVAADMDQYWQTLAAERREAA